MSEEQLQLALCDWLRWQHPTLIWRSDYASGLRLRPPQAIKHKRMQSSRSFPDLFVYEPRQGKYGLALELKRPGVSIYKKDGSLVANPHIREQAAMLDALRQRGYQADFAIGIDDAMLKINNYIEAPTRAFDGF